MSTLLDNLYQTLNERADLVVGLEKVLYSLSTDFALFLGKKICWYKYNLPSLAITL